MPDSQQRTAAALAALVLMATGALCARPRASAQNPLVPPAAEQEAAAAPVPGPTATPEGERGPLLLWQIEGSTPHWLLGTIHLPDGRVAGLAPEVVDALEHCQVLYTETSHDEASQAAALQHLVLEEPRPLSHRLPKALYDRLDLFARSKHGNLVPLDGLQLWAIALHLTMIQGQGRGSRAKPLDRNLWDRATELGIACEGLERLDEHFSAFTALSEAECHALLETTLDGVETLEREGRSPGEEAIRLYLAGDVEALRELALRFIPGGAAVGEKIADLLVERRNLRLANRIDDKIRSRPRSSSLFAIGAAHLGGPGGVLARLRAKGLVLTRIEGGSAAGAAAAPAAVDTTAPLPSDATEPQPLGSPPPRHPPSPAPGSEPHVPEGEPPPPSGMATRSGSR